MLFDKDFRYTDEAYELEKDISNATRKILLDKINSGLSPRDVEYIAQDAIRMTCLGWFLGDRNVSDVL